MHRAGSSERTGGNSAARRSRVKAAAATSLAALTALAITAGVAGASNHSHASVGSANHVVSEYGTVVAGTLPSVGTPKSGGTITIDGVSTNGTPLAIFPITSGADSSTPSNVMVTNLFTPVFYGPDGARPQVNYALSLASEAPVGSDGDKTFTVHLKSGLKWSDGTPVTSTDILFFYDLLKAALKASPANWGQYSPGLFPDDVASVAAPTPTTFVIHLKKAANPGYFLYNELQDTDWGLYALPAQKWDIDATGGPAVTDWKTNPADALKIYTYLEAQGTSLSTFATNPLWQVNDGPYKLASFNPTNSSYVLTPNKDYSLSEKPRATIDVNFVSSETALLDALKSGAADIGMLDAATQLGAIPDLKSDGYTVFGTPDFGWYGGIINFKDTTDHFNKIIVQPYVDKALAELIDQPAIIKGVYHGWAVPASGPIPSAPTSPYSPPNGAKPVFPFDPSAAAKLLKAHGWDVKPGGQTVCAKAGTGAADCGAGIPKGTPFKFVWANVPESAAATGVLESEAFSSQAKASAGVTITLVTKTFNTLTTDYDDQDPSDAKYTNDWAVNNFGGIQFDYYPTQDGLLSPGAGFNFGDYNNPEAIKLMDASASSRNPKAVISEVEFESRQYPVFFFPDEDQIYAVSNKVGGSANAFLQFNTQVWAGNTLYLKK